MERGGGGRQQGWEIAWGGGERGGDSDKVVDLVMAVVLYLDIA